MLVGDCHQMRGLLLYNQLIHAEDPDRLLASHQAPLGYKATHHCREHPDLLLQDPQCHNNLHHQPYHNKLQQQKSTSASPHPMTTVELANTDLRGLRNLLPSKPLSSPAIPCPIPCLTPCPTLTKHRTTHTQHHLQGRDRAPSIADDQKQARQCLHRKIAPHRQLSLLLRSLPRKRPQRLLNRLVRGRRHLMKWAFRRRNRMGNV
jgi:hypothetical protein